MNKELVKLGKYIEKKLNDAKEELMDEIYDLRELIDAEYADEEDADKYEEEDVEEEPEEDMDEDPDKQIEEDLDDLEELPKQKKENKDTSRIKRPVVRRNPKETQKDIDEGKF